MNTGHILRPIEKQQKKLAGGTSCFGVKTARFPKRWIFEMKKRYFEDRAPILYPKLLSILFNQ